MRGSVLVMSMVALIGCVTANGDPTITISHGRHYAASIDHTNKLDIQDGGSGAFDICELAAELGSDNICSLICDPDAITAELSNEGMPSGTCYELACVMTDGTTATVGVCLAPPN